MKFKPRICTICNQEFMPRSSVTKVCDKCKTRICKTCGKEFYLEKVTEGRGAYCSTSCYLEGRWGGNKTCKTCGIELQKGQFTYCSTQCRTDYWNRNDYRLIKKAKFWKDKLELINELGGQCVKCGLGDFRALEIHHKDADKKTRPPNGHYTWQRRHKQWKQDKENLELLCANCHRIVTWEQRGYGNTIS